MSAEEAANSLPSGELLSSDIFVANLSSQATVEVLQDFFSYCGPVTGVTIYELVMFPHLLTAENRMD